MGLSSFNRMRAKNEAERKAIEAELASKKNVVEGEIPSTTIKPKRKKTDAEKLKSKEV